jgi:hypothetical protein
MVNVPQVGYLDCLNEINLRDVSSFNCVLLFLPCEFVRVGRRPNPGLAILYVEKREYLNIIVIEQYLVYEINIQKIMMKTINPQTKVICLPSQTILPPHFWLGLLISLLLAALSPILYPVFASDVSLSTENTNATLGSPLPALREFVIATKTGDANSLVGVYVPGVLALPIVQQPANQPGYVSPTPGVATQFRMAMDYGTQALLAHNYLSGEQFFNLQAGQRVILVYGDGKVKFFEVSELNSYQALSPNSPYSNFIDLSNPGAVLSAADVFLRNFAKAGHLVFQTCIEAQGVESWGRLFVAAQPVQRTVVARAWWPSF